MRCRLVHAILKIPRNVLRRSASVAPPAATWLLLSLLPAALLAAEATPAPFADALLARKDLPRGIWALPHAHGSDLACTLVQREPRTLLVHAMLDDPSELAALRKRGRQEGWLGYNLYAEPRESGPLPYADGSVDVVLITDLTDAGLADTPLAEILRVLTPQTGVALLGLAAGTPGRLSRVKLEPWAKAAGTGEVSVEQSDTGLFAFIRKPALPGSADWTHRLYDAANHMSSADSAAAWPVMTQWLGRPLLSPQPVILAAGGRMASIRTRGWGSVSLLSVHDLGNGRLLWYRPLRDASAATRTSGIVLQPDTLYMAESNQVLRLDPATGAAREPIDCSALGKQVKWVAFENGRLHVMAGPMEPKVNTSQTWKFFGVRDPTGLGRAGGLGVFELKTAKWLWTKAYDKNSLDEGYACVKNGRMYVLVHGQAMLCLDAASGKELWSNADVAKAVEQFDNQDSRGHIGALMATDKYLGIIQPGRGALVLSIADGAVQWAPEKTKTASMLFMGDLLLSKGDWRRKTPAIADAPTGKTSDRFKDLYLGGGCGSFAYSRNLFAGQWGLTYDLEYGHSLVVDRNSAMIHKTPCLTPPLIGDGSVVYGSVSCVCGYALRGTIAQASAPPSPSRDDLNRANRLVKQPDADRCTSLAATPTDWPTFRADVQRSNASAATVPDAAAVGWTYTPEKRLIPNLNLPPSGGPPDSAPDPFSANLEAGQATAVGDLAFVADIDGTVTAVRLKDGAVAWRAFTPGRIYGAPTVWEGRVYIGSGDGRVYCYEAASGRDLWRYDAAPAQRRIMVYGNLMNTWPITGGVPVQDGTAYAIAGVLDVDGTSVVALDAKTGTPLWRNDDSGHILRDKCMGVSGVGVPAIAKGRLWLRSASYDLKTGQCRPFPVAATNAQLAAASTQQLQTYTGFCGDMYLVSGGRRFFDDTPSTENRGGFDVQFLKLDDKGLAVFPALFPVSACRIMPAWDRVRFLAFPQAKEQGRGAHKEDLICWDMTKTANYLASLAVEKDKKPNRGRPAPVFGLRPDGAKGETFKAEPQLWSKEYPFVRAAVLAKNAAVAAWIEPQPSKSRRDEDPPAKRYVAAFSPESGEALWRVELPGEPIPDGLSIARDGTVLVRLLDGGLTAVSGVRQDRSP